MNTMTVLVSIGNTDDRLTQVEWSGFHAAVDHAVRQAAVAVHGEWHSPPAAPWQSAAWSCGLPDSHAAATLRAQLATCARTYGQDAIAWTEGTTAMIGPSGEYVA